MRAREDTFALALHMSDVTAWAGKAAVQIALGLHRRHGSMSQGLQQDCRVCTAKGDLCLSSCMQEFTVGVRRKHLGDRDSN